MHTLYKVIVYQHLKMLLLVINVMQKLTKVSQIQ